MTHPLIEKLTKAWAGDEQLLIDQYTEDCTFEDKAFGIVHKGHQGLREVFAFTFGMMPDFRVDYGEPALTADNGAVQWTFTGSFQGEYDGVKHSGTPVRIEGVSFMTFRDGKILTNTDYWNVRTIEEQLASPAG
ncbi:MAG: ester cyclase [Novosphingobium sp.]|nr:ester cyclase [Novosphingobium sp.]